MPKETRLKLDSIKIQSFVTIITKEEKRYLKGDGNPLTVNSSSLDHREDCGVTRPPQGCYSDYC